jgi:hypothetical protein
MSIITGAALNLFVVNMPAAKAELSEYMSAKSLFLLFLIPQLTPAALNPEGAVTPFSISLNLNMFYFSLFLIIFTML